MKKIYASPELEVAEIELIDCLANSQSKDPEDIIPDQGVDGDDGDFGFDW